MVVVRLVAWKDVAQELHTMFMGDIIDAFIVTSPSLVTGINTERWFFQITPLEMEIIPSIIPPCREYHILGRELIHLGDREIRLARVVCIPNPS